MRPMLFDTSIYITALRIGNDAALGLRRIAGGAAVWLSSVVLEELYAGAAPEAIFYSTDIEVIVVAALALFLLRRN